MKQQIKQNHYGLLQAKKETQKYSSCNHLVKKINFFQVIVSNKHVLFIHYLICNTAIKDSCP